MLRETRISVQAFWSCPKFRWFFEQNLVVVSRAFCLSLRITRISYLNMAVSSIPSRGFRLGPKSPWIEIQLNRNGCLPTAWIFSRYLIFSGRTDIHMIVIDKLILEFIDHLLHAATKTFSTIIFSRSLFEIPKCWGNFWRVITQRIEECNQYDN